MRWGTTAIITVASVPVELVLGFGFAWVMFRIVRGRSVVRTAILVPYGIITVVSASPGATPSSSDQGS